MDMAELLKNMGALNKSDIPEGMRAKLEQMTKLTSLMDEAGFDLDEMHKEQCEEKRHLPLYKVRDQPGKPFTNLICNGCGKEAELYSDFLQCSRCKATKYCSKQCQIRDWQGNGQGPSQPRSHKDICSELAKARQEFQQDPECGETLRTTLFASWANQHHPLEGSFFESEFRYRLGIVGQEEVGFWAVPKSLMMGMPYMASGKDKTGFQNGAMLLKEKFPSLAKGWKALKPSEYPPEDSPDAPLPPQGIRNWREYFAYRKLQPTSVAPLLLSYVLTVYQMLHHELGFTKERYGGNGKTLMIYLVGAEIELNFVPLFGELAYLMPGMDLNLIMISPAAKQICQESSKHPKSILAQGKNVGREYDVLDVQAPADKGGGRVRVGLYSQVEYLHEIFHVPLPMPQAVIGLNAGLGAYPTWPQTILGLLQTKTPFCFTDQTKMQMHFVKQLWMPDICKRTSYLSKAECQKATDAMTIKLNPFHGVVNRDISAILVPNINNGYLLTWNP